ncbi:fungal-specific transcription factor domain-containing protein [Flagelloscypha sp. PMI_526]|nr:fungal-specific transcription factor domain-containing protein [Flagelloscypha sp. PMI_526]
MPRRSSVSSTTTMTSDSDYEPPQSVGIRNLSTGADPRKMPTPNRRGTGNKSGPRTKDGCWTCRLRGKACDLRKHATSNSCKTCIRLGIECMGWGTKLPLWLTANKKEIKNAIKAFTRKKNSRSTKSSSNTETDSPFVNGPLVSDTPPTSTPTPDFLRLIPAEHRVSQDESRNQEASHVDINNQALPVPFEESNLYFFPMDGHTDHFGSSASRETSVSSQAESLAILPKTVPHLALPFVDNPRGQYTNCLQFIFLLSCPQVLRVWKAAVNQDTDFNAPTSLPLMILPLVRRMKAHGWGNDVLENPDIGGKLQSCLQFIEHGQNPRAVSKVYVTRSSAIAALSVISVLLWAGGQYIPGHALDCRTWINILVSYAEQTLSLADELNGFNGGVSLSDLPHEDQVIIRTSIWFDVWSSISLGRAPMLTSLINRLWNTVDVTSYLSPNPFEFDVTPAPYDGSSQAEPPSTPFSASQYAYSTFPPPFYESGIRMEDINGATEVTMYAIAQTSQLMELIERDDITNCDAVQDGLAICARLVTERGSFHQYSTGADHADSRSFARNRTRIAFNAAAQLLARAAIDQNKRSSRYIQEAVQLTRAAILSCTKIAGLPVFRSLYLPVFLCGALTDNDADRTFMKNILTAQTQSQDRFGNGALVLGVLEEVWAKSPLDALRCEVPWRKILMNSRVLLI